MFFCLSCSLLIRIILFVATSIQQENPFKILCAIGVPTVFYIFKGREGQQHLQLQMKLMHTRVFGQFAVISMLLSLMGFKEYMDRNGKYITEADVQSRVAEMQLRELSSWNSILDTQLRELEFANSWQATEPHKNAAMHWQQQYPKRAECTFKSATSKYGVHSR